MRLQRPVPTSDGRLPRVTIVVPCYNYGRYLRTCVESALRQPGVETSVIIVDDCSTDDSADVAGRLSEERPAVRVIRHEANRGAIATFNDGLAAVDSDYLALVSADDVLAPGALSRAAGYLEAKPRAGMVYGRVRSFSDSVPVWSRGRVSWTSWTGGEWLRAQFRRGWNSISSPEVVVRTEVQHAVGSYTPALAHTHDLEMWLRIAAVSDIGRINGVDQAFYRVHGANMSGSFATGATLDLEERWDAYRTFLEGAPASVDVGRLGRILRRRASEEVMELGLRSVVAGEASEESITAVRDLAVRIDPTVPQRPVWADLDAAWLHGGADREFGPRVRSIRRDLSDRARWWRWQLVGV